MEEALGQLPLGSSPLRAGDPASSTYLTYRCVRAFDYLDEHRPRLDDLREPAGAVGGGAGPAGIRNLHFPGHSPPLHESARQPLPDVVNQLEAYFAGERQAFELDLDLAGNPLQLLVWAQLREIPYGTTTTYGELAARIDGSHYPSGLEPYKRVRLAAAAIGRTPTPILVPCHRVIGADGSLTGYGGGLERKQALLDPERGPEREPLERNWAQHQLPMR